MGIFVGVFDVLARWLTHPTTWVTASAWLFADLLKVLILKFRYGVTDWRRFFGTGGMPSSHTDSRRIFLTTCSMPSRSIRTA